MVTACKHVYAIHHQYQPSHFMLAYVSRYIVKWDLS